MLSLLAAAVLAPISEELFYRGFATTAWLRSYGPTRAIVQGGLFFAFVHVLTLGGPDFDHAAKTALVAFVARIPVALALGWLFVRRGSRGVGGAPCDVQRRARPPVGPDGHPAELTIPGDWPPSGPPGLVHKGTVQTRMRLR